MRPILLLLIATVGVYTAFSHTYVLAADEPQFRLEAPLLDSPEDQAIGAQLDILWDKWNSAETRVQNALLDARPVLKKLRSPVTDCARLNLRDRENLQALVRARQELVARIAEFLSFEEGIRPELHSYPVESVGVEMETQEILLDGHAANLQSLDEKIDACRKKSDVPAAPSPVSRSRPEKAASLFDSQLPACSDGLTAIYLWRTRHSNRRGRSWIPIPRRVLNDGCAALGRL